MEKTIKLYDNRPYDTQFTGSVVSVRDKIREKNKEDGILYDIVLDRTLFFPEEGGQTPDRGVLGGFEVVDVQIEGDVVTHTVRINPGMAKVPRVGEILKGRIDWEHRYSNMQNHTGEHIISGLFHKKYGFDNIGFHLSDHVVTLDLNGQVSDEQIRDIEMKANEVVWDNLKVTAEYPPSEELQFLDYRSKIDLTEGVRIVTIPGVDCCACCAPHVARTGEIGLIKITHVLRYNGGMRLTIICGRRAVLEMQQKQAQIEQVSHLANCPQEEIGAATQRLLADIEQDKYKMTGLEMRIGELILKNAPKDRPNVWIFENSLGEITRRKLVNALCAEHDGLCGVFAGTEEDGYQYIIGASTKKPGQDARAEKDRLQYINGVSTRLPGQDARTANDILRKQFQARGGGKPAMVQGRVMAAEEEIRKALEEAGIG